MRQGHPTLSRHLQIPCCDRHLYLGEILLTILVRPLPLENAQCRSCCLAFSLAFVGKIRVDLQILWVTTYRMLLVSFDEASWEGCHIHNGIILFVVRQTTDEINGTARNAFHSVESARQ